MDIKIDYKALELAMEKPVERLTRPLAIQAASEKFNDAKSKFLINFGSHPISKEIEEGEQVVSEEFIPSQAVGNLFSFIGFEQGTKPVEDLYNFLNENISMNRTPFYDKARKRYVFDVYAPSRDEIADATPMPFGTTRSWVYGIESGIAGLNHYLTIQKANLIDQLQGRKRTREGFVNSRSSTAIQSKSIVNQGVGAFTPQRYLTDLLKTFTSNLK